MPTSCQLALYPLRTEALTPAIDTALAVLHRHPVTVAPGDLSTLVTGEPAEVFDAVRDAYVAANTVADCVLVATFSDACPSPATSERARGDT